MLYITRKEHFNAAHRLFNPTWSEARNDEVFGQCANKNWHGHNYDLFVTIKGEPNPDTGFIMNVKELSQVMKSEIVYKLDHKNLNVEVDFMKNVLPSTENLTKKIWEQLALHITSGQLHCVKLYETESIYAEYFGE